ncbi:MAG: endo-1,4-beta-xylanase [Thermoguttaceae bacterium]
MPNTQLRRFVLFIFLCLVAAASVRAGDPELDRAIAEHRMGTLTVLASPGQEVRVQQLRHEFWFGAALSSGMFSSLRDSADAVKYKQVFLENFNAAVTENALKWHAMEHRQGQVDYSVVDAILQWTDENQIPLRGHNLFWGIPQFVPAWQKSLDAQSLREVVKNRALTIAERYRGRFAEYDLNNEMIHGNFYQDRLGPEITKEMADWVRQGDADAVLYLNDYDILTGKRLDDYVAHARGLLEQGVPIGGIGVQGHLHGDDFDPEVLKRSLATLAELNLPICVTEFNFPGQRSRYYGSRGARLSDEEEEAKARAIADYYRICFAQPAVKGILMWGFWERANWIPVSSLYRADWTPTPAAKAYRDLVYRQWWTEWTGKADASGRCQVKAFYGKHRVTVGTESRQVELKSDAGAAEVTFR